MCSDSAAFLLLFRYRSLLEPQFSMQRPHPYFVRPSPSAWSKSPGANSRRSMRGVSRSLAPAAQRNFCSTPPLRLLMTELQSNGYPQTPARALRATPPYKRFLAAYALMAHSRHSLWRSPNLLSLCGIHNLPLPLTHALLLDAESHAVRLLQGSLLLGMHESRNRLRSISMSQRGSVWERGSRRDVGIHSGREQQPAQRRRASIGGIGTDADSRKCVPRVRGRHRLRGALRMGRRQASLLLAAMVVA